MAVSLCLSSPGLAAFLRLIPRRGAGPSLRSDGGHEIDEYLMRLLRVGAANEIEATVYVQVHPIPLKPSIQAGLPQ